jgi:hypothetical protein
MKTLLFENILISFFADSVVAFLISFFADSAVAFLISGVAESSLSFLLRFFVGSILAIIRLFGFINNSLSWLCCSCLCNLFIFYPEISFHFTGSCIFFIIDLVILGFCRDRISFCVSFSIYLHLRFFAFSSLTISLTSISWVTFSASY